MGEVSRITEARIGSMGVSFFPARFDQGASSSRAIYRFHGPPFPDSRNNRRPRLPDGPHAVGNRRDDAAIRSPRIRAPGPGGLVALGREHGLTQIDSSVSGVHDWRCCLALRRFGARDGGLAIRGPTLALADCICIAYLLDCLVPQDTGQGPAHPSFPARHHCAIAGLFGVADGRSGHLHVRSRQIPCFHGNGANHGVIPARCAHRFAVGLLPLVCV